MEMNEYFAPIFEVADWITQEIYDMDYDDLDTAFSNVFDELEKMPNFQEYMKANASELSQRVRQQYEKLKKTFCAFCNEPFEPYGNNQYHCSASCRREAKKEHEFDELRERLNELDNYEID